MPTLCFNSEELNASSSLSLGKEPRKVKRLQDTVSWATCRSAIWLGPRVQGKAFSSLPSRLQPHLEPQGLTWECESSAAGQQPRLIVSPHALLCFGKLSLSQVLRSHTTKDKGGGGVRQGYLDDVAKCLEWRQYTEIVVNHFAPWSRAGSSFQKWPEGRLLLGSKPIASFKS